MELSVTARQHVLRGLMEQVQEEQYRAEISLRVQKKVGSTEQVEVLTTALERYEMMLDELHAVWAELVSS
ncbi:MAG: hypothetical protein IPM06_17385 [Rhizobiales bacterium]|nr:hypothetical protein [Hyphomicrobiales bacterium]